MTKSDKVVIPILIPAYEPDQKLLNLVVKLTTINPNQSIVIIDDGSSLKGKKTLKSLKNNLNVHLVVHKSNLGKGRAIKTGLSYMLDNQARLGGINFVGCVTADADGQHSPEDIFAIQKTLAKNPHKLVLGRRLFGEKVPLRSKAGNLITKFVLQKIFGFKISDTQTGLRGLPLNFFTACLDLDGDRYEYEINMLMASKKFGVEIIEKTIKTIYIENNRSSHFNPLIDSVKIYFQLFKFGLTSLGASGIDYIIFYLAIELQFSIGASIIIARLVSGNFQYFMNKQKVFEKDGDMLKSFLKYWSLVLILGTLSYFGISFLTDLLRINVMIAKVITEVSLFICSFFIQREFVFYKPKSKK